MLRKQILKKIYLTTLIIFLLFTISSFTKSDNIPNTKIEYRTNLQNIYLLNNDNYLVEVGILLEDDLLKNIPIIINNLKNNSHHYNGLKGLIPNNTKINKVSLEENILLIDFNNELLNVKASLEEKIIESIVFSLLGFKEIEGIKITINNNPLTVLPKSNIILDEVLTKNFGINKEYNITSINDIKKVVLYYYQDISQESFFVPVTKYVNNKDDKIKIIIDNLRNSYLYKTNLMSYLNEKTALLNYEYINNIVTLSFSSINDFTGEVIEEELIYTLSNSIFSSTDTEQIIFMVNEEIFTIRNKNT